VSRPWSYLERLTCSSCDWTGDPDELHGLCPRCSRPLFAAYDLAALRDEVGRGDLAGRPWTMWRYHELLPVQGPDAIVSLGEVVTPLVSLRRLGAAMGVPGLLMKDDGLVPTGSFKARGAAVGVSRARELGVRRIAMPTNGNAGAAWALYGARAGLETLIAMPVGAPDIARRECAAAGAELFLVDGLISDAGRMVAEVVAEGGWVDVATLKEPYRVEGKKTMGLEMAEQLGWELPDVVVYPTGGGVGLIGILKAMRELRELGWVEGRLPRFVAVQAAGCAPVVQAWERGARACEPWPDAQTVAFGINVPKPLGDFLVLDALYGTDGCAVAVSDDELLAELAVCARLEGHFVCPEGAAALAAVRRLRERGWLETGERVVVLNTGSGLRYPESVEVDAPVVPAGGRLLGPVDRASSGPGRPPGEVVSVRVPPPDEGDT
jgi:threonine synthase